ncbi:MAG: M28 family peptidase [Anaerolineae bacterium]
MKIRPPVKLQFPGCLKHPGNWAYSAIALALIALLTLTQCTSAPPTPTPSPTPLPRTFQGDLAYDWVIRQTDLGYRITGTEASLKAGDMFIEALQALGWSTREQTFTYRETPVRNILAWRGEGPAVLLGAHYDTRRAADEEDPSVPVLGANDGASGVAVLLELARALDWDQVDNRVYLAFFDAEDNGRLDGWEWIVGSTYMAEHWGEAGEPPLTAMVLVDMVGDADQQLYYEGNSDPALSQTLWNIAADLGYEERFIPQRKHTMIDDHVPFARMGVPAMDIIDFNYPYWHTTQDTPDKVSAKSLEAVGRTLEVWLEE